MIEVVVPRFNHYMYIVVVFAKKSHHWVVFIDTKCSTQILNKNSSIWSPYFFWVWFQTQQWGLHKSLTYFLSKWNLSLWSPSFIRVWFKHNNGFPYLWPNFWARELFQFGLCLYFFFGFWFKHNGFILHHHHHHHLNPNVLLGILV